MKKILMLVAALFFATSLAYADGHGKMKGMDNGSETGIMMKKSGNAEKSGSCGAGKCGDSKKEAKKAGSCGAGKCGDSKKEKPKKPSGSCGAGKCG